MKRLWMVLGLALALGACEEGTVIVVDGDPPAPPVALQGSYSNFAVTLTWELSTAWDGEFFRVYARRVGTGDFFFVADVTSCGGGFCEYIDTNISELTSYEYFVSAVGDDGQETDSADIVRIDIPAFTAPAVPLGLEVIALDNANFVRWADNARNAADFSFYRVYLLDGDDVLLLGETDSPGFLDLLATNGVTSAYVVSAVDEFGHESETSLFAEGTPRVDFSGELIVSHFDDPSSSGFRFQEAEDLEPLMNGNDDDRHFRFEVDGGGYWLVPGPGTAIYPTGEFTTALKCGVAADQGCIDWSTAPTAGYGFADVSVEPEFTYMFEVVGDDGQLHYGSLRVALVGVDQDGRDVMVFDWAYQPQAGNPALAPAR